MIHVIAVTQSNSRDLAGNRLAAQTLTLAVNGSGNDLTPMTAKQIIMTAVIEANNQAVMV